MNYTCLCVIVTGLLFKVFAQDNFHYRLWRQNLLKINEEIKKRKTYELNNYIMSKSLVDEVRSSPPPRPNMKPWKAKDDFVCVKKTGISRTMIARLKGGDWRTADQKAKEWVQCVLMKKNLMTDQSVFRLDVAFKGLTKLEKQLLEANIDKCLPVQAMPPVEISWHFAKCFQRVDPENSLF